MKTSTRLPQIFVLLAVGLALMALLYGRAWALLSPCPLTGTTRSSYTAAPAFTRRPEPITTWSGSYGNSVGAGDFRSEPLEIGVMPDPNRSLAHEVRLRRCKDMVGSYGHFRPWSKVHVPPA